MRAHHSSRVTADPVTDPAFRARIRSWSDATTFQLADADGSVSQRRAVRSNAELAAMEAQLLAGLRERRRMLAAEWRAGVLQRNISRTASPPR
jgi:hypothetical protein